MHFLCSLTGKIGRRQDRAAAKDKGKRLDCMLHKRDLLIIMFKRNAI